MAQSATSPCLAVVGCGGNIGSQLLELIDERAVPYRDLRLFRLDPEGGETIHVGERRYPVRKFDDPADLKGADLVFVAAPHEVARRIAEAKVAPVVIDLGGHNLAPASAPVVAPAFTPREEVRKLAGAGPLHVPHPAAVALATIAQAIGDVPFIGATILASASWSGRDEIRHLVEQSAELLNGRLDLRDDERQAAFNLGPWLQPELSGIVLQQVGRLLARSPIIALQLGQVPILHGTALSIVLPATADSGQWRDRLRSAPGILLVEDEQALSAVDAIGNEALLVSLRDTGAGYTLWCIFDNARQGALTALWIAECLLPVAGNLN